MKGKEEGCRNTPFFPAALTNKQTNKQFLYSLYLYEPLRYIWSGGARGNKVRSTKIKEKVVLLNYFCLPAALHILIQGEVETVRESVQSVLYRTLVV